MPAPEGPAGHAGVLNLAKSADFIGVAALSGPQVWIFCM